MSLETAYLKIQQLQTSDNYYASHGNRFARTLYYMNAFGMHSGRIIDIGGGGAFGDIFHEFSQDALYESTNCDLRDSLPYNTDTFSYGICCEVIEHLSDNDFYDQSTFTGLFMMLTEAYRVLKYDAKIIFTTPNISSYAAIRSLMLGSHPFNYHAHCREYTLYELTSALSYVGFEILHASAEYVWMTDENLIETFNKLMHMTNCSTENRGDDLFIVCKKPRTGEGRRPSPHEAGKILSPQLKQYQSQKIETADKKA